MDRRIDVETARAGLDEIITAAVQDNTRTIIERDGTDAVVILSLHDYRATMPASSDWLRSMWAQAQARGLAELTQQDIDDEIAAARREIAEARPAGP